MAADDLEAQNADSREVEHPFKGVIVCTTSLSADQRTDVAKKTRELGGILRFDLTPDVTHLLVGEYDTPKYRHVAKERPDIKVMDPRWVDAVREPWLLDQPIAFETLEKEWQLKALEPCGCPPGISFDAPRGFLLFSVTGFNDYKERQHIIDTIEANGARYTGDLSKQVSHLIVNTPEGRKYEAARQWGIHAVSVEWLFQSCERGLILDERCFDPLLPPEQRGQGAWNRKDPNWNSLGKRAREDDEVANEEGQRKLKKTASVRLTSQRDNLWGDILRPQSAAGIKDPQRQQPGENQACAASVPALGSLDGQQTDAGIFSTSYFYFASFSESQRTILSQVVVSLGGHICATAEEVALRTTPDETWSRYVVLPQDSRPESHPVLPYDNLDIITEFYIERCLHHKTFFHPHDAVLGRPFAKFPLEGFELHTICSAGLGSIDLFHVEKSVLQLGGKFTERLGHATTVLIAESVAAIRKEKVKYALDHNIPIVSIEWLWHCIMSGYNAPTERFLFPELKQRIRPGQQHRRQKATPVAQVEKTTLQRTRSTPLVKSSSNLAVVPPKGARLDRTAFDDDGPPKGRSKSMSVKQDSDASTHFETAKTHQEDSFGGGTVTKPLSEVPDKVLNRSPSPKKARSTERTSSNDIVTEMASEKCQAADIENKDTKAGSVTSPGAQSNHQPAQDEEAQKLQAAESEEERKRQEALAEQERTRLAAELEEERKRQEAQDEAEKREVERRALAAKLSSLIESKHAEAAASNGFASASTKPRRRRGVFSRALSNASVASNDGAATLDPDAKPLTNPENFQLSHVQLDGQEAGDQRPPPATQVGWEDPQERRRHAEIMRSMSGASNGEDLSAMMRNTTDDEVKHALRSDRVTLADLDGQGPGQIHGTRSVAGRRAPRRRF